VGRGGVRFEEIIRALNVIGYSGPLSVEWEDTGMDREAGAAEAAQFCLQLGHAGRKGATKLMWDGMDQPLPEGAWPIVSASPLPYYPNSQVPRELEGHVVVQFTVTRTGATRDIRVLESSSSLFEPAAVTSAAKYRYKPRVINGEPVEVPGVQTLVRFVLQD
jgi:TonB family protein